MWTASLWFSSARMYLAGDSIWCKFPLRTWLPLNSGWRGWKQEEAPTPCVLCAWQWPWNELRQFTCSLMEGEPWPSSNGPWCNGSGSFSPRPDQSPETILSKVQQWKKIPVHTISFNCADTKANSFLARLSAATAGRWDQFNALPTCCHATLGMWTVTKV